MQVGVVGINHKSSGLTVREVLAKSVQNLTSSCHLKNSVVLSTCNRTEIYFSTGDLAATHSEILYLLREGVDLPFEHFLYSYFGKECFLHLAKVTSGFDSVIFGETEIQRQVKQAYENACQSHKLSSSIHFVFQKALKMGKDMRNIFRLPIKEASLEAVIFELLTAYFAKDKSPSILFIGNSEINRKVLEEMKKKRISNITLATRSPQHAKVFADFHKIKLMPWDQMIQWPLFDMVVCGTNQRDFLLRKEDINPYEEPISIIPARLIIDLSMPRSVDPMIGKHPQVSLFNIEEINAFILRRQKITLSEKDLMLLSLQDAVLKYISIFDLKQQRSVECDMSLSLL